MNSRVQRTNMLEAGQRALAAIGVHKQLSRPEGNGSRPSLREREKVKRELRDAALAYGDAVHRFREVVEKQLFS